MQPGVARRFSIRSLGFIVGICVIGICYQQWGEYRDARLYPAPGEFFAVGEDLIHLRCIGSGNPTVMMISGSGTPSVTLYPAQELIAKGTRVCSYDRSGLGWSEPGSQPKGLVELTAEFAALVETTSPKEPVIIAAESFGGQIALSYAQLHPEKVTGIVFIDSSEPELTKRLAPKTLAEAKRRDAIWQVGWRLGIIRGFMRFGEPAWLEKFPDPAKGQFRAVWAKPMAGFGSDWIDAVEQTKSDEWPSNRSGILGDMPIVVIKHGKESDYLSQEFQSGWEAAQAKLAALSSHSETVTASENGHPIAEENPALVANFVAKMVRLAKQGDADQ